LLKQILAVLKQDLKTRGRFDFEKNVKSGVVLITERAGRVIYYPEYSDDWRVSTSLIFFNEIAQAV